MVNRKRIEPSLGRGAGHSDPRGRARLLDVLGLSTHPEDFTYGRDPRFGVLARAKIPDRWIPTTCGYCSVGCGMLLGVRGNSVVSVRGDPDHPVNEGKLCPKGLAEHVAISAPGRALYPARKSLSGFRRISWDEALELFLTQVKAIQDRQGKESFAVLSTGQLVTEEFYTLGKLVQLGFQTPHYDGNTTLCMASAVAGYKRSFGSDGPPGNYEDIERADVVMLIGANIADNHPILAYRLFKNLDRPDRARVIVVDPRVTKTALLADHFLALRPRTDVYLLNGLAHLLIRQGWVKEDYVRRHTRGYDELRRHIEHYPLQHVARVTRLPESLIFETARAIGTARSAFFAWTMGVNHSTQGTETVNAIINLALLTGNVGVPGGSPFSITGQCNAMGSRETSFTSSLPGYRKFERVEDRRDLAQLWSLPESSIPRQRGLAYPDIIQGVVDGRIRGLWIIGTNPFVSYPDQNRLRKALRGLEFLAVQDGYHPTPTSEAAHLVLPAAIWGEKEGTYTNSERRVSKVNAAVRPPGEARPDFEIFLDLARRLGAGDTLFPGWQMPRDAFDEWRRVSRGRLCDYSGITYEKLEHGTLQWPAPEADPMNGDRLYTAGRFETEDGKASLFSVRSQLPPEEPDGDYPYLLNTGRIVEHWHTRTKTGKVPILEQAAPEAWIEINPRDAERLRVGDQDRVSVRSRRGSIDHIRVRVTSTVGPGQVFIPFHFEEANANNLTIDASDPISREPNFKQCAVRVERIGPE
ncbi:MAG: nitrate reductase [Planctomycetes bacterium]|nr:nitrate reductase [Planctomycetota bacterium]